MLCFAHALNGPGRQPPGAGFQRRQNAPSSPRACGRGRRSGLPPAPGRRPAARGLSCCLPRESQRNIDQRRARLRLFLPILAFSWRAAAPGEPFRHPKPAPAMFARTSFRYSQPTEPLIRVSFCIPLSHRFLQRRVCSRGAPAFGMFFRLSRSFNNPRRSAPEAARPDPPRLSRRLRSACPGIRPA